MNERKLTKSFRLVKEDIGDLYGKIEEISNKVEEILITQRTLADKIVKKANKFVKGKTKKTKK